MASDSLLDRVTRFLRTKAPEDTGQVVITEDKDVRHAFPAKPDASSVAALAQDVYDALMEDADAEDKTVFRQVRACTAEGLPLATLSVRVQPRGEADLGAGLAGTIKMLALHAHQSHQEMIEASREMRAMVRETLGAVTPVLTSQTAAIDMLSGRLREMTARMVEAEQVAAEAVTTSEQAAATVEEVDKDRERQAKRDARMDRLLEEVVFPALKEKVGGLLGAPDAKPAQPNGAGEPHGQA